MSLVIEVIKGHEQPRNVNAGKPDKKAMWVQEVYLHNGGAFPAQARINLNDSVSALPVGTYALLPTAFRVGNYGDIEVSKWDIRNHLEPVAPAAAGKK